MECVSSIFADRRSAPSLKPFASASCRNTRARLKIMMFCDAWMIDPSTTSNSTSSNLRELNDSGGARKRREYPADCRWSTSAFMCGRWGIINASTANAENDGHPALSCTDIDRGPEGHIILLVNATSFAPGDILVGTISMQFHDRVPRELYSANESRFDSRPVEVSRNQAENGPGAPLRWLRRSHSRFPTGYI